MVPDLSGLIYVVYMAMFGVGLLAGLVIMALLSIAMPLHPLAWLGVPVVCGLVSAIVFRFLAA